ncbi:MAG TPA: galactoside O-acetyltransferase [Clostridiales bacterium]|jgi:galactoside O-acetyltransferase|nr:galactoside O-acetyltransferase [Clostridiales bacterium]
MTKLFGPTHYTEEDLANEGFKSLGSNVRIAKTCTIVGAENISIGDNVRIDGYCTLVAAGCGFIHFGSYIHVGGHCVLLAGEGITFEDFSCLSWGVKLFSRSDDFSGQFMTNPTVPSKYTGVTGGPIVLKRHVVVGAGSVVLPKVTLEEGVAVGALSLVTKSLAEWGIYSGIPAKHIKNRKKQLLELESVFLEESSLNRRTKNNNTLPSPKKV